MIFAIMRLHRIFPPLAACLIVAGAGLRAEQAQPVWPEDLAQDRRALLESAMAFHKANPEVPYKLGSADASGMDCSGAIFFLLKQAGQEPPRSAHEQYLWLKKLGRFHEVPTDARDATHPAFAALQPGDLVFWAHDGPDAPVPPHASHVHMYLGKEADGHAIMIGSSEGRSYRHHKINGFGITDFHISPVGSPTRIIGYGPPPFPLPPPGSSTETAPSPNQTTP